MGVNYMYNNMLPNKKYQHNHKKLSPTYILIGPFFLENHERFTSNTVHAIKKNTKKCNDIKRHNAYYESDNNNFV